jgi:RNA polymerase sigma-70 factor, ECF subfamily
MGSIPKLNLPPPFEDAMRLHEREIMRYLLRITNDREDALDLFQETWMRAYRSYPQLDSAEGLRPWLFRIATNLSLNRKRDRVRRARMFADGEFSKVPERAAPSTPETLIDLQSAIERLPHKQRAALVMRKIAGLEYEEIACALECSFEAARAGVYQALKKIRAEE